MINNQHIKNVSVNQTVAAKWFTFLLMVTAIINEMRQLTEAQKTPDIPENDCRMSDKPQNNETRQGETPHGAALPP